MFDIVGHGLDDFEETENLKDILRSSKLPLYGFLPNSILYKHKEPEVPKVIEKPIRKELVKYKYPSQFLKVNLLEYVHTLFCSRKRHEKLKILGLTRKHSRKKGIHTTFSTSTCANYRWRLRNCLNVYRKIETFNRNIFD